MLVRAMVIASVLTACAAAPPTLAPKTTPVPGKGDGVCPGVAAQVTLTAQTPFSCGSVDTTTAVQMNDIDTFWSSQVALCSCGPDYTDDCSSATARAGGWVYASEPFVDGLRASGSDVPSAYVLAHELGHEIQGVYGVPARAQAEEAQADCLAGFYLGSLVCNGAATADDLRTTLATACPVADLDSAGTCDQRAGSVARGIAGYLAGGDALVTCQ